MNSYPTGVLHAILTIVQFVQSDREGRQPRPQTIAWRGGTYDVMLNANVDQISIIHSPLSSKVGQLVNRRRTLLEEKARLERQQAFFVQPEKLEAKYHTAFVNEAKERCAEIEAGIEIVDEDLKKIPTPTIKHLRLSELKGVEFWNLAPGRAHDAF